jgi:hypothetical protein
MADRGPGTVKVALNDEGRAVLGDVGEPIYVNFAGGPIFLGPMRNDLPPFVPLAFYRTELVNYEPQRGTMISTPAIVAAKCGAGRVVAISPHPETTPGLEYLVRRSILATARTVADQTPTSPRPRPHTRPKNFGRPDGCDRPEARRPAPNSDRELFRCRFLMRRR